MKKNSLLILLTLVIHLTLLVLLRFDAWPEMTLWPYLTLNGWLPYKNIAMAHNPLLIFDLAIFYKIFGLSLLNLKLYTWTLILVTDLLIYFVTFRLTKNSLFAFLSLIFYILWQPYFEGNGLWFDLALAPVGLLIFCFLWEKKFFWSGIFLGVALLLKQTAFWFIFPIILTCLFFLKEGTRSFSKFLLGLTIPLSIFVLYLLFSGSLQSFCFWAIQFGSFYLPRAPGQVDTPSLRQMLFLFVPFALALIAIVVLIKREKILMVDKSHLFSLLLFCFFGSLGILPRWSLFHFQPALPFLAIISGIIFFLFWRLSVNRKAAWFWAIFFMFLAATVYLQVRFYRLNFAKPPRFFEKETLQMALWLKAHTQPKEKIFILNSWDHLYALSNTLPASRPWLPTLPWYMDYPGIQEKIVLDLQRERPKIIIVEDYKKEGLGSYRPEKIDKFLKDYYDLKTIVAGRFKVLSLK
jgi:hypothetical protein